MHATFPLLIMHVVSSHTNINYHGPFGNLNLRPRRRSLIDSSDSSSDVQFYHGVASGEPSSTSILLWTRVTPPYQNEYAIDRTESYNTTQLSALKSTYSSITISYAISPKSADANLSSITDYTNCPSSVVCGSDTTSSTIDFTFKTMITSLSSDTEYIYHFRVGSQVSPMGKTRTLPAPGDASVSSYRFAAGSCKQSSHGFFNNLADIANLGSPVHFMLWLGDYIYEFPETSLVNGSAIGRTPYPNEYLFTLSQYRKRHLSHKLEAEVQLLHAAMPWIMTWDDHEVVNDYWKEGAPTRWHNETAYPFADRKANGYQAYFEWVPIASVNVTESKGLHRLFQLGTLMDLLVLDSRSQRTEAAQNVTVAKELGLEEHYAYGETQREWIVDGLVASMERNATWRILGNNDIFGTSPPASVFNGKVIYGEDKLEGYPVERQAIVDSMINEGIVDIVGISGGPHAGCAQKVFNTDDPVQDDDSSFAVFTEFTLDAISAPKLFEDEELVPYLQDYQREWGWVSPYYRLQADGFIVVDVAVERVKVEFWVNENVQDRDTTSELDQTICVYKGTVEFAECAQDEEVHLKSSDGWIVAVVACAVLLIAVIIGCVMIKRNSSRGTREEAYSTVDAEQNEMTPLEKDTKGIHMASGVVEVDDDAGDEFEQGALTR